MSWGTPTPPQNTAVPAPIRQENGELDWTPVIQSPNYDPAKYLADEANPYHAAWLAKRDAALAEWETAKGVLDKAKESEAQARKMVQTFAFGPKAKEGMNNQPLNNGFTLKFGRKLNYGFKASNEQIDKAEDEAAKFGNGRGQFLFERIIVWKPEFSKSEYNKLDVTDPTEKQVKELIDQLLEIKEATGSLEIKAPKATLNG